MDRKKTRQTSKLIRKKIISSIVHISALVLGILSPSAVYAACSPSGLTVTRISAPKFYIDDGVTPNLQGQYVGYKITNTGTAYADLWTRLQNFTGGVVNLSPNEDGVVHVGPLGIGQTTTVYFYLTANQVTEVTQSHDLSLYTSNPSVGNTSSFCADNFSFLGSRGNPSVISTIKASPNVVDTVTTSPNPPEVGGKLVMTVTGNTGQIGQDRIFSASAASLPGWPANVLELTSSKIEFLSPDNTGIFNDRLYLAGTTDIPSTVETNYRVTYTFTVKGTVANPISVNPLNNISSGNPLKHTSTDTAVYLAIQPIQPPELKVTASKSALPTNLITGGTVTYTVTFNNTQGTVDAVLDAIIDTLPSSPSNTSYIANSAKFNGVSIPNGNISISGQTLMFSGLYTVPAGATSTLTYQATIPATNGSYINSVIGRLGSVQVDTTTNTTDNSPATATVTVGPIVINLDYSDAPITGTAPNGTGTNAYGEAIHEIVAGIKLGATIDAETTSIANATASGDGADDDGISSFPRLTAGAISYSIPAANVAATGTGTLSAWIDFNKDGVFSAAEYTSVSVTNGTLSGSLNWSGISIGSIGKTFARFRFTSSALIDNTTTINTDERAVGVATDGEVEDYAVTISTKAKLLLVKRITAIKRNGETVPENFTTFVDDSSSTTPTSDDNHCNWLGATGSAGACTNTYTLGKTSLLDVQTGDEIEYTVYYLNGGGTPAKQAKVCDRLDANLTFQTQFDNSDVTTVGKGLVLAVGNTAIKYLTNTGVDTDGGQLTTPSLATSCNLGARVGGNLSNDVIVVNVGTTTTPLINSTSAGIPATSYGYIRFRAKVK